ncbi:MAG: bifunctional glutamate N-acetyltransferase/amino-acid acetyltransferase ArgJ [Thermoleophilia bacterium]|nr:bifunctional glutamate N-acetyltransferase/amino-acid acetyltransferase ArgJ [Thermoleophilia bacterium]
MSGAGPEHPVVVDPGSSRFLSLPEGVTLSESEGVSPGVTYARGFLAAGVAARIKESGRKDLGVVAVSPQHRADAVGAAVFTTNSFAAAPVVVTRKETSMAGLTAVVMNSGNANACTGEAGLATARIMQNTTAQSLGLPANKVAVASTGIIGVPLKGAVVARGIREAAAALSPHGGQDFAECIVTTDRFAKACAFDVTTVDGVVRLGACAKGAGMISPGMATMLCLATTDAALAPSVAKSLLMREVGRTFNRISVDGQMSTNDCVFFMANGASNVRLSSTGVNQLGEALRALLLRLALMMVADGEGATKVVHLLVRGARSDEDARVVARAVADSTLVKTAMYGGDPNWGRILSSAGAALPQRTFPAVSLDIGDVRLVRNAGAVDLSREERERLHEVMRSSEVDIVLDLQSGVAISEIYFSDLGHEYVTINAEYHT